MKLIQAALLILPCLFIFNTTTAQSSGFPLESRLASGIEKVYLQTDRDYYLQGDTIWYKACLLYTSDAADDAM